MLDDHGFEIYEGNQFPMAYLLTFRTYGTWLHGDERGAIRRNGNNRYGGPKITPSVPLKAKMEEIRKEQPFLLNKEQRAMIQTAFIEVCEFRSYFLRAANIRINHAHGVVSAAVRPEKIVNDLKVYGTRKLRAKWQCSPSQRVWARGSSTRYLWKPRHVEAAIDYVKYCQEDIPFEFRD